MAEPWDTLQSGDCNRNGAAHYAGFDPYSLQLANGPRSLLENNGVPLASQTSNADSSRAGQFFNGAGYAGVSNTTLGTLTLGRQNSLTLDGVNSYDPMGGSYALSVIGFSGATAGVGDTEDARYTSALKYRVDVGMFRAAALYQFGSYGLGNASSDAYQFQLGGDFSGGAYGKLSFDAIYSHVDDAVSTAALSAAQNLKFPGTLAATISDDSSVMLLANTPTDQSRSLVATNISWSRILALPNQPSLILVDSLSLPPTSIIQRSRLTRPCKYFGPGQNTPSATIWI
jgi:hypothetical protein